MLPRRRSLRARPPLATGDRKLVPATPHDVGLALQRGLRGQRTSESGRGCRRRSPRKRDRRRYPVFLVLGSLYSRTAENSIHRKPSLREDLIAAIYLLGLNSGQGYAQRRSPRPSVPRAPTDIRFSLAHPTYLTTTLTSSLCSLSYASEIAYSLLAFSLYE